MKLHTISLLIAVISSTCTSTKKSVTTQNIPLPSIDSFRTAHLAFLTPEKQLAYYQNIDRILPTNKIEAGNKKHSLIEAPIDLTNFSFSFKDAVRTINDFINDTKAVGVIVLKNDTILFEKYINIQPTSKWIDFSVAKSVTSLLSRRSYKRWLY